MLPDRLSNPGPLTYESGAIPIAPRGPAPVLWLQTVYIERHKTNIFTGVFDNMAFRVYKYYIWSGDFLKSQLLL